MSDPLAKYIEKCILDIRNLESTRLKSSNKDIHVTDLFDFCPRKYFLAELHGVNLHARDKIGHGTLFTFKLGQIIEGFVIQQLLPALYPKASQCNKCGKQFYSAPLLQMPLGAGYQIVGHVDAILRTQLDGVDCYNVIEIKSIDGDKFSCLTQDSGIALSYKWQLMTYLFLLEKDKKAREMNFSKRGYIVYISKKHTTNPVKVFPVERDESFNRHIRRVIRELKTFIKNPDKSPERICLSKLSPVAKKCRVVEVCFEEPPSQ